MDKSNTIRIVTIVSFFIILYFLSFFIRFPFFSIQNVEAIPRNTLAFVEFSNEVLQQKKMEETDLIQNLNTWSVGQKVAIDLEEIKTLFGENMANLKSRKLSIAFANGKADEIDFLYVLDGLKKKYLQENNAREYTYLDQPIYEIKINDQRYTYAFYRNLLLFARYSVIVEDAISQLKRKRTNLCHQKSFKHIYKKKNEAKTVQCFINPSQLTTNWKAYFKPQLLPSIDAVFGQMDWTLINVKSILDDLFFSSKNVPHSSNELLANIKQCGQESAMQMPVSLPNNTSLFQLFSFKGFHFISKEKETIFNQYFRPWIGENITFSMTEPYRSSFENEQFMVLDCKSFDEAKQALFSNPEQSKTDYMSYEIGQINVGFNLPSLFGLPYKSMQQPFFSILDQRVVFAQNINSLKGFLDKYTVNQTLSNDPDFIKLWNASIPECHSIFYNNPKLNTYFLNEFVQEQKGAPIKELIDVLTSKKASLWKTNVTSKSNQTQIYYNKTSSQSRSTSIAWRATLKAKTAIQPQIVEHKEQSAIMIQDVEHRLYLLNKNGKTIWEKMLDAPILSDIFELDYYQNGEDYYLFNTKNNIYLVDAKGEDVRSYPFSLKSPMSNGLIAIDFDGTKQFDYFVACENRNIYGFDQQGKPLSGWNPNFSSGIIRQNFKHFQYQNKDYIISVNTGSKLQVHQRNGKPRFNPVFLKNSTAFDFENKDESTRIVAMDNGGRVRVVNSEGASFRLGLCQTTDQTQQFTFTDMIGDERKDYFQLVDSTVCCKYYDETTLKDTLNYSYEYVQDTIFGVPMYNKNKSYLGSLNAEKAQINLLNNRGTLCNDFPLAGTTPFVVTDLFDNQQNILVVGNGSSVYAYQLSE